MRATALALALLVVATPAAAEPAPTEPASPRSIGRAGVGLVSDDSGLNLLNNPAAIARRGGTRLTLGMRLVEVDTEVTGGPTGRTAIDQSGPAMIPAIAVARGLGERWVVGASFTETTDREPTFPSPAFNQPAADVEDLFFYRYGGLAGAAVQRTVSFGAAVRATDWLAVGAALRISTLEVSESRAVWAGFSGVDPVGSAGRDLALDLSADTLARPGGAVGLLAAPIDVPIELAASFSIDALAALDGDAALRSTTDEGTPPSAGAGGAASIDIPTRIVAATGARYLGERLIAEVNAELSTSVGRRSRWELDPIEVTDDSGAVGELTSVEPLVDVRRQVAVRGAVDVALVPGFLWITAGYGFTSGAAPAARRSALLPGNAVHRLAAGVEALWGNFTVTIGYARELSPATRVGAGDAGIAIVNPFDAGSGPATEGRYRRTADLGALGVEYAW